MQHFHVPDVVNVKRLLQAHNQPLKGGHTENFISVASHSRRSPTTRVQPLAFRPPPSHLSVELDGQDGVGVGVVADLGSLLEVADFELPRGLQADDGHQAAGEEPLHDAHVLRVHWRGRTRPKRNRSAAAISPRHPAPPTRTLLPLLCRF